jgi:FkbM family methyltransferase
MAQDELIRAIAIAGRDQQFREATFDALRRAELSAKDTNAYRTEVRWPLISAMLAETRYHQVELSNGLKYEVGVDSRIEQALLLSREAAPDHVWEPQTTRLLVMLAATAGDVLVGGAYIGDQVVPIARAVAARSATAKVHAFEPMAYSFGRLVRNVQLNGFTNVVVNRAGLWDKPGTLNLSGEPALSTTEEATGAAAAGESVPAIAADDYAREKGIESVGLIMLDTEGGEEKALRGARGLLARLPGKAPNLVFEVHRHNVDWSNGLTRTPILSYLADLGYTSFAVRDYHDNVATAGLPIEMIPADRVYLEGPPHGFNMFATKDAAAIAKFGIELVNDVSPKLILGKNPALHAPMAWQRNAAKS